MRRSMTACALFVLFGLSAPFSPASADLARSGTHFGVIAAARGGELKIIGGSNDSNTTSTLPEQIAQFGIS